MQRYGVQARHKYDDEDERKGEKEKFRMERWQKDANGR
jgi:hypothetical protein